MKKKIRVKPLIGDIEESVWNDADEQAKPNDKDLLPKHFKNVQILIEQVLKNRKQKKTRPCPQGELVPRGAFAAVYNCNYKICKTCCYLLNRIYNKKLNDYFLGK